MRVCIVICTILFSLPSFSEVLTFGEWKQREVYRAKIALKKQQALRKPTYKSSLPKGVVGSQRTFDSPVSDRARGELRRVARVNREKNQHEWRLQAASGLSVQDFAYQYVINRPNFSAALTELSEKMPVDQMAIVLVELGRAHLYY